VDGMTENPPATAPPRLLTHSLLMGERLYLHTYVRLGVALVIGVGAYIGRDLVGIDELDLPSLVVLAVAIAGYNAVAYSVTRRWRAEEPTAVAQRVLLRTMYAAILMDYLALTVAIWLVGGARSPFLAFYLLHLMLGCIYLSPRAAIASAALAFGLLVALVLLEVTGLAPPHLPMGAVTSSEPLAARHAITVLVVYGLLFGLTSFLLITLSHLLRRGEEELRSANEAVTRLSSMRRDFLHIAVHNLRSPLGVTTMFLEHMRAELGGPISDQQRTWLDTCLRRIDGLQVFLQDLQLFSSLDSGELEARMEPVAIDELLAQIVDDHLELVAQHEHEMRVDVEEGLPKVLGVRRLLREAVTNYVTNAVKYTPDGGTIVLRARAADGAVRIEVEDTGVGIPEDERERLFTEFFRGKRKGTPLADVEGTGLGLSIVRRVANAHRGRVDVSSEPGRGSVFSLELPTA
jgi:signal transduction histidine kinase